MRIILAAAAVLLAQPAVAGPKCTTKPKNEWIGADAMVEKLKAARYSVDVFKITSGRCYEIYGRDPSGRRVEVYFHPVTGRPVRRRSF